MNRGLWLPEDYAQRDPYSYLYRRHTMRADWRAVVSLSTISCFYFLLGIRYTQGVLWLELRAIEYSSLTWRLFFSSWNFATPKQTWDVIVL
jgi:hypothetical protein